MQMRNALRKYQYLAVHCMVAREYSESLVVGVVKRFGAREGADDGIETQVDMFLQASDAE